MLLQQKVSRRIEGRQCKWRMKVSSGWSGDAGLMGFICTKVRREGRKGRQPTLPPLAQEDLSQFKPWWAGKISNAYPESQLAGSWALIGLEKSVLGDIQEYQGRSYKDVYTIGLAARISRCSRYGAFKNYWVDHVRLNTSAFKEWKLPFNGKVS